LIQKEDGEDRLRQETFPLVYAILPDKRTSTYKDMFTAINELDESNWAPDYIILDFEMAAINVVTEMYPTSKVRGCWFHFNQSIFRKAQELGFQHRYQEDMEFRNNIKLLSALAFVPKQDVVSRFLQLFDYSHGDLKPLLEYFSSAYVGIFKDPLYPIEFWNLSDRIFVNVPKTSNFVEGWHNKFQRSIGHSKPKFWRFLYALLSDQRRNENSLYQLFHQDALPKLQSRKYRHFNMNVRKRVKKYRNRSKPDCFIKWLRSIAYFVPNYKK